MIKSFKCKHTEKIYKQEWSKKFPPTIQAIAMRKLWILNAVVNLQSLDIPPSNRLEKLIGKRQGQYSIRINSQWRICFCWNESHAYEVEIVDYH